MNCATPEIIVNSVLICMDQDDGTDGISHVLKILEKTELVDLIKTGTEGRKNCLTLESSCNSNFRSNLLEFCFMEFH